LLYEFFLEVTPVLDESALEQLGPAYIRLGLVEFMEFGVVATMAVVKLRATTLA
jgi:hypothetical protein